MKATFWDKRVKKYDDDIKKHDAVYAKTIERAKSLLTPSDMVLDFACASGEMSLDIASAVHHVHGIDLSGKMIELATQKARERQITNINFAQTDLFDPKLAPNSLSAILAFNILHLVENVPQVLARLHDLLAADGVLISQTPCLGERSWIFWSLISLAQKVGVVPPIRSFTRADLESLVASSDFEITETQIWDEKMRIQWIVARKKRAGQ